MPSHVGVQAGQVLSPRQAMLVLRQAVLVPRQAGSTSQERVQTVQVLSPRQANPQPRNSVGNTGFHSQAGNPKPLPLLPGRSSGSVDTLPQAHQSLSPSQGTSGATAVDIVSSPRQYKYHQGIRAETWRAGAPALPAGTSPTCTF